MEIRSSTPIEHECSVREIFKNKRIHGTDLGYSYSIPTDLLRTRVVEGSLQPACETTVDVMATDMRVDCEEQIELEVQLAITELRIEDVVVVVRETVDAQVEAEDGRVEIHNPTEQELELLSEYTHSSESIRSYTASSEEKLVLKLSGSDDEPYSDYEAVSVEYGELLVDYELRTENIVASLSHHGMKTSIYESDSKAIAVSSGTIDGVSIYDLDETSIEAVVEYYWQYRGWILDYQSDGLDLRDEDEVKYDG